MTLRTGFLVALNAVKNGGPGALPTQISGSTLSLSIGQWRLLQTIALEIFLNRSNVSVGGDKYRRDATRIVTAPASVGASPPKNLACYTGTEIADMHGDFQAYATAVMTLYDFLELNP